METQNSELRTRNSKLKTLHFLELPSASEMVCIPAGDFVCGNDSIDALDNERPAHSVYLETYWIDRYPVTCGQFRLFMEAGRVSGLPLVVTRRMGMASIGSDRAAALLAY